MEPKFPHWIVILCMISSCPVDTLQCNCAEGKCLADGSCENGYTCKSTFFGGFCEYKDLLERDKLTIPELRDESISTCADINDDLIIPYGSMKVYMVRLYVRLNDTNLSFTFKEKGEEKSCEGHLVDFSENEIEYYCDRMFMSQELIIRGFDGDTICHVYVTEGRNMLQNANITTRMIPINATMYDKSGLIDGNREHIEKSCFLTGTYKTNEGIYFVLKAPAFVNNVNIFGNTGLGDQSLIFGASVMLQDTNRKFKLSYQVKELVTKTYYSVPGSAIRAVNLLKSSRFGACELEVVGDCANGTFGHDCKSTCKSRCKDSRCTSKGKCIGCKAGLVGKKCCMPFCDPTQDCSDVGMCKNGCVKKKYGVDCTRDCSPNCGGDGECIDGICSFGCKPGFFKPSCTFACSPNCGGSGDCQKNGSCISGCKTGYSGHDCTKHQIGCNCVDLKCLSDDSCEQGYQCKNKYFGYFCEYADLQHKQSNVPAIQDEDLKTCSGINENLVITYNQTRILMVRLIVENSEKLKNLHFMFEDKPGEESCHGRLIAIETNILEYYCDRLIMSRKMIIRFIDGNVICHIYVTEGRNMILRPLNVTTTSTSNDDSFYDVNGMVDGNREFVKGSCYLTRSHDYQTTHTSIIFKSPAFVNFMQFFGQSGQGNASFKIDASVHLLDDIKDQHFAQSAHLYDQSAKVYSNVGIKLINAFHSIHHYPFGFCEIEVIGDCAYGYFGHDCSSPCSTRCKDSRCTSKGVCIGCKDGLVGERCCRPFCNPDKDCDNDGNCINGCVNKKYGLDCAKDCSPYCAGSGTCNIDGVCTDGCEPGFFGPQCHHLGYLSKESDRRDTMNCHCSEEQCKTAQDKCQDFENCATGWFGKHCVYKDLSVLAIIINESLNDNNIDTCLPDDTFFAGASWQEPIMFSFAVLTFKDDADIGSFIVMTKTENIDETFIDDQFLTKWIKKQVFMIQLMTRIKINELTISWTGDGSLCSMSVGADRNLALELANSRDITQYPEVEKVVKPLTDGDVSGNNCINTKEITRWGYTLQKNVAISTVVLFPDISETDKKVITVNLRSLTSTTSRQMTIFGNRYSTVMLDTKEIFNSIDIKMTKGNLNLCEMEIFGECIPPYYGLSCKAHCPSDCHSRLCDITGQCIDADVRKARKSISLANRLLSITCTDVIVVLIAQTVLK